MEAYSAQMQASVLHQVQQASLCELLDLLRYFRQRGGPGLGLVTDEIRERWARRRLNHPPPTQREN
jgi:hypothetical protein